MAEKDIVNAILRYLKSVPDSFCWKEHGGMYGTAGIPDIIACIGGRFVAFEVKTPSGKLTKLQETAILRIRNAQGNAYKVTSVEEVISVFLAMKRARTVFPRSWRVRPRLCGTSTSFFWRAIRPVPSPVG